MAPLAHLQIRNAKDDETTVESATQIFASLLPYPFIPYWTQFFNPPKAYSFELYLLNQTVYYYVTAPSGSDSFIHSLISSSYPKSLIQKTTDPMEIIFKSPNILAGELCLNAYYYLPIKTYQDFANIDTMSALIGFLARQDGQVKMGIQIIMTPASFPWQANAISASSAPAVEGAAPGPSKAMIAKKAAFQGGRVAIRVVVSSNTPGLDLNPYLQNLAGTFGSFALGEGNQFSLKKPRFFKEEFQKRILERKINLNERKEQILNAQELASLWHPSGMALAGIKNIAWGKTLSGEPPENLPIVETMSEEDKKDVNFFAKTDFKNKETIFGIKAPDRRKHMYIIGKTGAGKSTLIANMAIDDIRKDRGIGIIDPHGDLSDTIIDFIPKRRMNDVIYLEPFDTERPFSINVLEVHNKQQKDLVASGIVSIFYKLYKDSWGPRLEYILRNVILTLLEVPDATLVDMLALLADEGYRRKAVAMVQDPIIKTFWTKEFDKMSDKFRTEAIAPIQNKVGQFVSSRMVRNIVGKSKSTVNLEQAMNEGKIVILNLSQGKLGEDNAALLGAMLITQMQLAAMNRSFIKEEDRRDFFLYVDEFQNFATSSFVKILSEARKYRLALTLANQYIDQLDETIQKAIFGNVGSLISFVTGASDASILTKEYAGLYTENDLVSLGKHEIVVKLSIDNMTSSPFPAKTLPLPSQKNDNRDKIIQLSKERYGRKAPPMIDARTLPPEEEPPQQNQQRRPQQPRPAQQNRPQHSPKPQPPKSDI